MIFTLSLAAQAGPSISISFGSGNCNRQPVFCPPRPVCQQPVYPAYYGRPVVYYNQAPAYCYGNGTRFSNVTGFVNGGQGVIRVAEPIYQVQPVTVYPRNSFRWR